MQKNKIDCLIFLSSEDDKYNVLGGIGTYIGLFSRVCKKIFPEINVYWLTKSINGKDFVETNEYGVNKHYVSGIFEYKKLPFFDKTNDSLSFQSIFENKLTVETAKILEKYKGKRIVIESGEWEGLAGSLFSIIFERNILKVVRLHTPLATCIVQNNLNIDYRIRQQLIKEFQTIKMADIISACTYYVKERVVEDVIGAQDQRVKQIEVIPNPIDNAFFCPGASSRIDGINLINRVMGRCFLEEDTFNIIILGSVESRKGVEFVVDSVPEVMDKIKTARFCFVGHCGDDNDVNLNANTKLSPNKLRARIPDKYHKYIGFTNYIEHSSLPKVICAGDVFPIMSLGDNFPGTVAEIALSAKPLLTLFRGGVKEMISKKREIFSYDLGFSLDSAVNNLVEGLVYFYKNPKKRDEVGNALRNQILDKYEPDMIVKKIINFYNLEIEKKISQCENG